MRQVPTLTLFLVALAVPAMGLGQSTGTMDRLQKALSLTPDLERGEHLYIQFCTACHLRGGWGNGPREVPGLAGQHEVYLLEQLMQFSTQERVKKEMHEVVTKPEVDNPQALRDVSAYIASRPRNPSPDRGDGRQLRLGAEVYLHSCEVCHARDGAGSKEDLIPAIGGQQYGYLLVRLRNFAKDHTPNIEPGALNILANLSPKEVDAVADYTSRLPALRAK
jgi:cytochrome c553